MIITQFKFYYDFTFFLKLLSIISFLSFDKTGYTGCYSSPFQNYCKYCNAHIFKYSATTTINFQDSNKVSYFQDNISQLKAKMASNAKECDERNRLIKEVR